MNNILDSKVKLASKLCLEDVLIVDEKDDYLYIDLCPNTSGPVLRLDRKTVEFTPSKSEINLLDGTTCKLSNVYAPKDTIAILMQPVLLSEYLGVSEMPTFRGVCSIYRQIPFYDAAVEAIVAMHDQGVIKDEADCKAKVDQGLDKLRDLLIEQGMAKDIAKNITNIGKKPFKCACKDAF